MRIDPAIAAMRRWPELQRRAQAAMRSAADAWRAEPAVAAVHDELGRFSGGDPLEACPGLHAALTRFEAAFDLVTPLCRRFVAEMARNRFGQVPFRHGFDGCTSTLLLARAGRVHLVLQAIEPGQRSFATASYSDAERHEIVLAGAARARVVRCPDFAEKPMLMESGACLVFDLSREAPQVLEVERRLVTLRLHRGVIAPGPSREYALAEGVLLHQSSGDIAASRREMMVALLGRMGCTEAAPAMAALACEGGESALRWQALRECLALDTAEGFRALTLIAETAADPLTRPARALQTELLAAHPELRSPRAAPCPA